MAAHTTSNSLFINLGMTKFNYKLHPLVVFSILDHFKRRPNEVNRVVGTLLGEVRGAEFVIKNCFAIPHTETEDQVQLDMEYHANMLKLHQRVNPKEVVVGWYSTGDDITYLSALIHQVYESQCQTPLLLTIDTELTDFQMGIKAYISSHIKTNAGAVLARFEHVKLELNASEAEKIGLDALLYGTPDSDALDAPATLLSDYENLEISLAALLQSIDVISEYVKQVVAGKRAKNPALGRAIMKALSKVPRFDNDTFQKMFNNQLQDLLMVMYLANLTRTQLALADKMQAVL